MLFRSFPGSKYHNSDWRAGDVMHTLADISDTENLLGYKPLVGFWQGLDKTIDWYKENYQLIVSLSDKGNI